MVLGGHHPRLIRIYLGHVTLLGRSVTAVEDEIEAARDAIPAAWESAPTASLRRDRAARQSLIAGLDHCHC